MILSWIIYAISLHSVALKYIIKRDVIQAVTIPGTKERNNHCMKFWWGFRVAGIFSSVDSGKWEFRVI